MGLHDEGLETLNREIRSAIEVTDICESDVSGWDWSVKEWELQMDLERRLALNRAHGTLWERVARAHYYCISRKLMVLSDGSMYEQMSPGVLPSGWYNTSSTNSAIRIMDHHIAKNLHTPISSYKEGWCVSMGDDAIEQWFPGAASSYLQLGKNMKMFTRIVTTFEFCSTLFPPSGLGYPVNVDKQLFKLLNSRSSLTDKRLLFNQFVYEMRNHPDKVQLESLAALSMVDPLEL